MVRFVFACLLVGSWFHAGIAAAPPIAPNTPLYIATIKYVLLEDGKETLACDTTTTERIGIAMKATLGETASTSNSGGRDSRIDTDAFVLKLDMVSVPGTTPSQYDAQFRLIEIKNGKQIVRSEPKLIATVGKPARLRIGGEKGDRIEIDLTVREMTWAEMIARGGRLMAGPGVTRHRHKPTTHRQRYIRLRSSPITPHPPSPTYHQQPLFHHRSSPTVLHQH